MDNLILIIENAIEETVQKFISKISTKYEINEEEIILIWNMTKKNKLEKEIVKSKPKKITKTSLIQSDDEEEKVCPYIFTRGANKGKMCAKNPRKDAVYCSRHKKYEGLEPKKETIPKAKKSIVGKAKKSKPVKKSLQKVLRKNKDVDKLWHQDTKLAFKSAENRVVFAKVIDGKLQSLEEEDIENCMLYGFAYDKDGLNDVEEEKFEEQIYKDKIGEINDFVSGNNNSEQNSDIEDILGELQEEDEFFENELVEEEY